MIRIVFICCALAVSLVSSAQNAVFNCSPVSYTGANYRTKLTTGTPYPGPTLSVDATPNPAVFNEVTGSRNYYVALRISDLNNPSAKVLNKRFRVKTFVDIYFGAPTPAADTLKNVELTVDYRPETGTTFRETDVYKVMVPGTSNGNFLYTRLKSVEVWKWINATDSVKITTASDPDYAAAANNFDSWYLDSWVELERYTILNTTLPISPSAISPVYTDVNEITSDPFTISWPPLTGAQEYEIEWTFVDNYKDNGSGGIAEIPSNELRFDFRKNSTRIRISAKTTAYSIPVLFERGYLLVRIRGVGRNPLDLSKPVFSPWSSSFESGLVSTFNRRYRIGSTLAHEGDKINYQVVTNYAEEGRRSDAVSYFDGMMRQRQSVTKSYEDNRIIASDQLYDYDGRPALKTLPAPLAASASRIKFYPNLNGAATAPYTRANFEKFNAAQCAIVPDTITNNNTAGVIQGAGQYYSPQNVHGIGVNTAYIPQSFGFAFTQTEFTKDNTGRVRRQGGVGRDHRLGSGHESKYYYGVPSQYELDRLFGNEVGDAVHYKKNMVIDPNGQASVSYLDLKGNVIATALGGSAPSGIDTITLRAVHVIDSLLDFTVIDSVNHSLIVQKSFIVPAQRNDTIQYRITPESFSLTNCQNLTKCMDCIYDLSIKLTRDEACATCPNSVVWSHSQTIGQLYDANGAVDLACGQKNSFSVNSGPITLPPGSYTVTKTLKVSDAAIDAYVEAFMASYANDASCSKWTIYQNQEMGRVDTLNCNIVCDACQPLFQTYLNTPVKANLDAFLDCISANASCSGVPNACEIALQGMMDDVSPLGQYARYSVAADTTIGATTYSIFYYAANDNLSILNHTSTNKFPNITINGVTAARNWKHPALVYKDENNQTVVLNINGTPTAVNSLELKDFIEYYQPSWAKTLVLLHPEYCSYQWCSGVNTVPAYDNLRDMQAVNTYAAATNFLSLPNTASDPSTLNTRWNKFIAVFKKYYESTPGSNTYPFNNNQTFTFGASFSSDQAFINNTLKRAAAIMARFQNNTPCTINSAADLNTCYLLGPFGTGTTAVQNQQWVAFRSLYMAIKNEVLYAELVADAQNNNCYNGCIGSDPFQYTQNNFTYQYNNETTEPCYVTTAALYKNKRKNFASAADLPTLNQSNINLYTLSNPFPLIQNGGALDTSVDSLVSLYGCFQNLKNDPSVAEYFKNAQLSIPIGCLTFLDTLQIGTNTTPFNPALQVVSSASQPCGVCQETATTSVPFYNPCAQHLRSLAAKNGETRYLTFKDSLRTVIRNFYYAKCMKPLEYFSDAYIDNLYHYTLYFYDQANNLVKTVPPHGVDYTLFAGTTTTKTQLNNIRKYRANNHFPKPPGANNSTPAYYPNHKIPTYYQYNSLNLVTYQWSTDEGGTRLIYDELRRLVRTHNANQLKKKFSYTLYDYLNRVVETGECAYGVDQDTTITATTYNSHMALVLGGIRSQIVRTLYDQPYSTTVNNYFGAAGQTNLRGRVSTIMYAPVNSGVPGNHTFEQATHFSYDIAGNVKTLLQDHKTFGRKRIDYEYEFISGLTRSVWYQKGRWDQVIHYYAYDQNNRLKWVQSSQFPTAVSAPNSAAREQEAQYFYYLHGPLRRMEIGNLRVQGLDYAYTLQGWIKGVNSGALTQAYYDMGKDGRPGTTNAPVARDAFGYVLGYYGNGVQNDYHPLGNALQAPRFDPDGYTTATAASLYNGNIPKMITATRESDALGASALRMQRMQYRYDQLQRLKTQTAYDWTGSGFSASASAAYFMSLSYDAAGNIWTMRRDGAASAPQMDQLTYRYAHTSGKPNRLTHIDDQYSTPALSTDLEDQSPNNYQYYANGNLKSDASEGGRQVFWNIYDKIDSVSLSSGTKTLGFGYDASGNRVRKNYLNAGVTTRQWYVRDAQGNVLSVYRQAGAGPMRQESASLYGTGRVGEWYLNRDSAVTWNRHYYRVKGNRRYELTNHLGNVLAVVTDRKMAKDSTSDALYTPQFYLPDVYSVQNYYAFGQNLPGWSTLSGVNDPARYRYGFNGKEDDDEWQKQDYGMRIYDARVARFLSVDPIASAFPWLTPYQFAGNMPVWAIDLDGAEGAPATTRPSTGGVRLSPEATERAQRAINERIPTWRGRPYVAPQEQLQPERAYYYRELTQRARERNNYPIPQTGEIDHAEGGSHLSIPNSLPEEHPQRRAQRNAVDLAISESQTEEYDYFYRAMSWKEYNDNGGKIFQRLRANGDPKGEGPFVTNNLRYLTNDKSFIYGQLDKYDVIVTYKMQSGTYSNLKLISLKHKEGENENITVRARREMKPILKIEGDDVNKGINFSFPGSYRGETSDIYFNPYIIETTVQLIKKKI